MPTLVHTLKEDAAALDTLHDLCRYTFLDGECYAFATALSEGLGWPIVGLMNGTEIRHAAVRSPDGKLHDVRGFVSEEEFGHPFGFCPPYEMRELSVADLHRDGEPPEMRASSVRMARKMAEAIWPDLPWIGSLAERMSAFADEFEILCRKHRLWIQSPVPATAPVIAFGEDDEGGYELRPTADGITFTIDRYLRP